MSQRRGAVKEHRHPKKDFLKAEKQVAYDRLLILCEDAKHAPAYFRRIIKDYWGLPLKAFVVDAGCPNTPLQIVNYAEQEVEKIIRQFEEPFDRVYCVFDRDQHGKNYTDALEKIKELNKKYNGKPQFLVADSAPCFEFWILLHFNGGSDKPIENCTKVIDEIKTYNKSFNKDKCEDFFDKSLFDKTGDAIKNAKKLNKAAESHSASKNNVFSNMDILLEDLREQSKRIK